MKSIINPKTFKVAGKALQAKAKAKLPEILIGLGIGGAISATALGIAGTIKAVPLVEKEKAIRKENAKPGEEPMPLTKIDIVKITWKCYVPMAATSAISTALLIMSSKESAKRNTALATAYKLSETALTEYKDAACLS